MGKYSIFSSAVDKSKVHVYVAFLKPADDDGHGIHESNILLLL